LQRKPGNRLGKTGAQEVKEHPWFKNFPWKDLYEKKLVPKFIPKGGDNFDQKYCQAADKIGENTKENYAMMIQRETIQDLFRKFTFISAEEAEKEKRTFKTKTSVRKFVNPHLSLSSSPEKTNSTQKQTTADVLPSIYPNKLFKQQILAAGASPGMSLKGLKKSSSALNFSYVRNNSNKSIANNSSYYFQN